ncbi:HEAT repeat domain-containing protein [Desulfolithobacter sp.]
MHHEHYDTQLQELLSNLHSTSVTTRRYAAEDLGDSGRQEAVPALAETLRDPEVAVREAAANALIQIGGEAVCQEMIPLLDDEKASVRNLALEVFEQMKPIAIPFCIELYGSSSHDLRKIAIDTLGKIEETRETLGFKTLMEALEDPHVNVATAACEALGRLGSDEAVHALSHHMGRHPWMDATIILSLARIGSATARQALSDIDPDSLDPASRYALQEAISMITG